MAVQAPSNKRRSKTHNDVGLQCLKQYGDARTAKSRTTRKNSSEKTYKRPTRPVAYLYIIDTEYYISHEPSTWHYLNQQSLQKISRLLQMTQEPAISKRPKKHVFPFRLRNASMGCQNRRHHLAADLWYKGTSDRHF